MAITVLFAAFDFTGLQECMELLAANGFDARILAHRTEPLGETARERFDFLGSVLTPSLVKEGKPLCRICVLEGTKV